jgi:hypothetical protein
MSKAKPWSKATAAQRENHRQRCIEDGKRRRLSNCIDKICEEVNEIGIDEDEFLMFLVLAASNDKAMGELQLHRAAEMLKEKKTAVKTYQEMFSCQS